MTVDIEALRKLIDGSVPMHTELFELLDELERWRRRQWATLEEPDHPSWDCPHVAAAVAAERAKLRDAQAFIESVWEDIDELLHEYTFNDCDPIPCPEDDTCECSRVAHLNRVMKGYVPEEQKP